MINSAKSSVRIHVNREHFIVRWRACFVWYRRVSVPSSALSQTRPGVRRRRHALGSQRRDDASTRHSRHVYTRSSQVHCGGRPRAWVGASGIDPPLNNPHLIQRRLYGIIRGVAVFTAVLFLYPHDISFSTITQLASPNLTDKCSTMSPETQLFWRHKIKCQGHESQKQRRPGSLHSCECWLRATLC